MLTAGEVQTSRPLLNQQKKKTRTCTQGSMAEVKQHQPTQIWRAVHTHTGNATPEFVVEKSLHELNILIHALILISYNNSFATALWW